MGFRLRLSRDYQQEGGDSRLGSRDQVSHKRVVVGKRQEDDLNGWKSEAWSQLDKFRSDVEMRTHKVGPVVRSDSCNVRIGESSSPRVKRGQVVVYVRKCAQRQGCWLGERLGCAN